MNANDQSREELETRLKSLETENHWLREQVKGTQQQAGSGGDLSASAGQSEPTSRAGQPPRTQKSESVTTLVGGIAHDFNNLLAGIMGNVFLLLHQFDEGPQKDRLREVQRMCQNAADMTAQMLIFSRQNVFKSETLQLRTFMQDFSKIK